MDPSRALGDPKLRQTRASIWRPSQIADGRIMASNHVILKQGITHLVQGCSSCSSPFIEEQTVPSQEGTLIIQLPGSPGHVYIFSILGGIDVHTRIILAGLIRKLWSTKVFRCTWLSSLCNLNFLEECWDALETNCFSSINEFEARQPSRISIAWCRG